MPLKIESLYYFTVLADAGSFTAAAERLFMTQQALSRQIALLEQALGKPLIHRNQGQGQRLTPAGELLRAEAQPLLARFAALEAHLEQEASQEIPLRIGALLVLDAGIGEILQTHGERRPALRPELSLPNGGPGLIESQLLAGKLDLGLLLQPPQSPQLESAPLASEPYLIVGKPGTRGEWNELSYLAFGGSPTSQDEILNAWPESEWPRRVVAKADAAMAIELAACGAGCLHIPRHFVDFASLAEICPAPFAAAYTPYLVWNESLLRHPVLRAIRDEILRVLSP